MKNVIMAKREKWKIVCVCVCCFVVQGPRVNIPL